MHQASPSAHIMEEWEATGGSRKVEIWLVAWALRCIGNLSCDLVMCSHIPMLVSFEVYLGVWYLT